MEILFWLVPAGVVTLVAMLWVGWWGREGRGEIDRETAARRLGEALGREQKRRPGYAVSDRTPDRSTGVALRRSRVRPTVLPSLDEPGEPHEPGRAPGAAEPPASPVTGGRPVGDRRAAS